MRAFIITVAIAIMVATVAAGDSDFSRHSFWGRFDKTGAVLATDPLYPLTSKVVEDLDGVRGLCVWFEQTDPSTADFSSPQNVALHVTNNGPAALPCTVDGTATGQELCAGFGKTWVSCNNGPSAQFEELSLLITFTSDNRNAEL